MGGGPGPSGSNKGSGPSIGANKEKGTSNAPIAAARMCLQANHSLPQSDGQRTTAGQQGELRNNRAPQKAPAARLALLTMLVASLAQLGDGQHVVEWGDQLVVRATAGQTPDELFFCMLLVFVTILKRGVLYVFASRGGNRFRHMLPSALLEVRKEKASGLDFWQVYDKEYIMVLVHHEARKQLFDPRRAKLPVPIERLTGLRISVLEYMFSGKQEFVIDRYSETSRAENTKPATWVGRTFFILEH